MTWQYSGWSDSCSGYHGNIINRLTNNNKLELEAGEWHMSARDGDGKYRASAAEMVRT